MGGGGGGCSPSLPNQSTGECPHETGAWSGQSRQPSIACGCVPEVWVWTGLVWGPSPQRRGIVEMRDSAPKCLP